MNDRNYVEPVEVEYREPSGDLWDIAKEIPTAKKWHHYFDIYEELFSQYRGKQIKMLEIGVYQGGSLEMWRRYFGDGLTIVGVDVAEDCAQFDNPEQGIHVRIGDQSDHKFMKALVEEFGEFDIILDDGGHMTSQQNASFVCLFKWGLKDGGLYVIEDLHSNFWSRYVDTDRTFIYTLMQVVEIMHAQYYWRNDLSDFDETNEDAYAVTMEYYEAWVRSVQFFDSIAAVRKGLKAAQITPFKGGVK